MISSQVNEVTKVMIDTDFQNAPSAQSPIYTVAVTLAVTYCETPDSSGGWSHLFQCSVVVFHLVRASTPTLEEFILECEKVCE